MDVCCICLERLRSRRRSRRVLACGHHFHHECIRKWVNVSTTCPVCRQRIDPPLKSRRHLLLCMAYSLNGLIATWHVIFRSQNPSSFLFKLLLSDLAVRSHSSFGCVLSTMIYGEAIGSSIRMFWNPCFENILMYISIIMILAISTVWMRILILWR